MQLSRLLVIVAVLSCWAASVTAQTPSPTLAPSPSTSASPLWNANYWGLTYPIAARKLEGTSQVPSAYYQMNDALLAFNKWTDSQSNAHGVITGVQSGAVTLRLTGADAVNSAAVRINSAGGYFEATLPSPFNAATTGVSFDFWFRLDDLSTTDTSALSAFTLSSCAGAALNVTVFGRRVYLTTAGVTVQSAPNILSDGTWAYVIVIYRETSGTTYTAELYVNGQAAGTVTINKSAFVLSGTCKVRFGDGFVGGLLDEIALYDRVLSTNDRLQRWSVGSSGPCARSPCFSGVRCTPTGTSATSYVCGTCPEGYTGDGVTCVPTGAFQSRMGCDPPADQYSNATWCSLECRSFTRCLQCNLKLKQMNQIQSRVGCRNAVSVSKTLPDIRRFTYSTAGSCEIRRYNYTGTTQVYVVPSGVTSISVFAWGAGGGGGSPSTSKGGAGGFAMGSLTVTPGEILYVVVGEGGKPNSPSGSFGGGGAGASNSKGASGGGYSGVFRSSVMQSNAVIIAGGGGGAGFSGTAVSAQGGLGGGSTGSAGTSSVSGGNGGGGSGTVAGTLSTAGQAGSPLAGGSGLIYSTSNGGGGGGGGYYGGGGGAAGGGGSGYLATSVNASAQAIASGSGVTPPYTTLKFYVSGTAVGGAENSAGGNGVLYIVPNAVCVCKPNVGDCRCDFSAHAGSDRSTCVSSSTTCAAILADNPNAPDGVYTITAGTPGTPVRVACDMTVDGGGWIVFQRREDGSVSFYRNYATYQSSFGNFQGEFWLGLDTLSRLSSYKASQLRVDMWDTAALTSAQVFAKYSSFSVGASGTGYTSTFTGYTGTSGDSLSYHNGRQFSTFDAGPSPGCASTYIGGWWYGSCHSSNLNGQYGNVNYGAGLNWYEYKGHYFSLGFVEMKFK